MSVLTLVRHSQASYMAEDYDRLSPLGEEQSELLGEFWAKNETLFHSCFCGPARRHIRTVEILGQRVKSAGLPWPEVQIVPELNEFDAFKMARIFVPRLVECDPEIRKLNEAFEANRNSPEAGDLLQKLFEAVSRSWCSGNHEMPELESWLQFRTRVEGAIDAIRRNAGRRQNILVITSAGVISATLARVLDLAPRNAIEFVWLTRNASYSEFLFSGDRFSMLSHNSIPHFEDKRLITYR